MNAVNVDVVNADGRTVNMAEVRDPQRELGIFECGRDKSRASKDILLSIQTVQSKPVMEGGIHIRELSYGWRNTQLFLMVIFLVGILFMFLLIPTKIQAQIILRLRIGLFEED